MFEEAVVNRYDLLEQLDSSFFTEMVLKRDLVSDSSGDTVDFLFNELMSEEFKEESLEKYFLPDNTGCCLSPVALSIINNLCVDVEMVEAFVENLIFLADDVQTMAKLLIGICINF